MPELSVTVDRVLYPPETDESARWFILATNRGVCKGSMGWRPAAKQPLTLEGEWTTYRGEKQFQFKSAALNIPVEPQAQLFYVCKRTPGFGEKLAQAVWDHYGADWRNLSPGAVNRVSDRLVAEFKNQLSVLDKDIEQTRAISFLMGKGCSQTMSDAAWERWKRETVGVVSEDCYHLAELPHFSFSHVDGDIRRNFGIENDDKRRIKAALIYSIRQLSASGSTVIDWVSVYSTATTLLGGFHALVTDCTSEMFEDGTLIGFKGTRSLSLKTDYFHEKTILEFIDAALTKNQEHSECPQIQKIS